MFARLYLPLLALIFWSRLRSNVAWPLSKDLVETAVPSSSVVRSISVLAQDEEKRNENVYSAKSKTGTSSAAGSAGGSHRLPPSPANLLKPDGFKFYTYNEKGDMITKQMTMQEIQALIAGGGPDHSGMEILEPQKAEDILTGGKKVMDVVQKVQNVLKSAMGKPSSMSASPLTGSLPAIPEQANAEWSNILPVILAGEKVEDMVPVDADTQPGNALPSNDLPTLQSVPLKSPEDLAKPANSSVDESVAKEETIERPSGVIQEPAGITSQLPSATEFYSEKPMIPVPVITTGENQPSERRTTQNPVFHKLTEVVLLGNTFDDRVSSTTRREEAADFTTDAVQRNPVLEIASTKSDQVTEKSAPKFTITSTVFASSTSPATIPVELSSPPSTLTSTKSSGQQSLGPLEPLSTELANSLSSVINQVSEAVSPILPVSSHLASNDTIGATKYHVTRGEDKPLAATTPMNLSTKSTADETSTARTNESSPTTEMLKVQVKDSEMGAKDTTHPSTVLLHSRSPTPPTVAAQTGSSKSADRPTTEASEVLSTQSKVAPDQPGSEKPETSSTSTSAAFTARISTSTFAAFTERISTSTSVTFTERIPTSTSAAFTERISSTTSLAGSQTTNPVSSIDSILRTASTETNTPPTEAIVLPDGAENLPANTLASGLVAGFASSTAPAALSSTDVPRTENSTLNYNLTKSTETKGTAPTETAPTESVDESTKIASTEVPDSQSSTGIAPTTDALFTTPSASSEPGTTGVATITAPSATEPVLKSEESTVSNLVESTSTRVVETAQSTETLPQTTPKVDATMTPAPESQVAKDPAETTSSSDKLTSTTQQVETSQSTATTARTTLTSPMKPSTTDASTSTTQVKNSDVVPTTSSPVEERIENSEVSKSPKDEFVRLSNGTGDGYDPATNNSVKSESSSSLQPPTATEAPKLNSTSSSVKKTEEETGEGGADGKWELVSLQQTGPSWSSKFGSTAATGNPTPVEDDEPAPSTETTNYSTGSTLYLDASKSVGGLDTSTKNTSADIVNFSRLCNELAFKFWISANKGLSTARSLALSPFGMTSLLAMIFLGARGPTSEQMNEVLGLDNVATFNPHLIFQNVTDAVSLARQQGIANAGFVRELFADKAKVRKLMPFYKEQAQQFYEGLVAEVNFATISDLARRRTNLLIRKQTGGRIKDFVKSNAVPLRSPLAAISANVFQTDCNSSMASATGRDGELYFAVSPALRLRKLVPVPATVWRSTVLAGYEPSLDATAVALGGVGKLVSTIFLVPGQQGHAAPGDTLDRLEQRLVKGAFRDGSWGKLLKVLIPRTGLELQVPKFSHRSVVNATAALKRMGLDQLFSGRADFKGINGIGNHLYLSDVLQMNLFSTCGDENIANGRHHVETYPASPSLRQSERYEDTDPVSVSSSRDYRWVLAEAKRKSERSGEKPRLKLDQPFLYFVRHNPTGLILHMGRFNPRLLT